MSILEATRSVPADTQSPATIAQRPQAVILTAHPNAKDVPPELMAAALHMPRGLHPESYAKGLRAGHEAALAAGATALNALTPAQAMQKG